MSTRALQADPHGLTKNQHFVSQVEQRLNAHNPGARTENQRIYEFEIIDRDRHQVRLVNPKGRTISSSLSMLDLFSFDVGGIGDLTTKLLHAHATRSNEINQEVFGLFVAKMVNFIRNPFSVAKVLDTFGIMGQHHPTDPQVYAEYQRILTGRRPHQAHLCTELGISDQQYEAWLRVLFMLLTPLANGQVTMLEQALGTLFKDRDLALHIHLHTYTTQRCLLSDRGWTVPVPEDRHSVFDFNLSAQAFIRYAFLDYEAALGYPLPPMIRQGLLRGPKLVQHWYFHDDIVALDVFHRRIIEQSFQRVFSSGLSPYSVSVTE